MPSYEALALVALAAVLGYAYYLYRVDTRPKPPGQEVPEPVNRLMFGRRDPKDRGGDGPQI
jgi:hypothetical protein